MKQELEVNALKPATRPDGSQAILIELTFNHPVDLTKGEKTLKIPVEYAVSQTPKENKVLLYLSMEDWTRVKNKFNFGEKVNFEINKEGKIIIG